MNTVFTILVTILIFGVLVLTHEYGHFIVAVKCGVTVEEFSIGFGPLLYSKKTKHTTVSLRAIPLGGYCKMPEDESGEKQEGEKGFYDISPLKRILLSAAGPLMNFALAIIIFFTIYAVNGTHLTTTIASLGEVSPARDAGIVAGDTIIEIDGKKTPEWEDVSVAIDSSEGKSVTIKVQKADNTTAEYEVTPLYNEAENDYYIGIVSKTTFSLGYAVIHSFSMVGEYIALIFDVFVGLFRGLYGIEAFSGPIGVTVAIGNYMSYGAIYVLYIAASLAVSIGFFNLLPIPALDGSKILFSFVEMVAGKPINRKFENVLNTVGFVLLMGFAAVVAYMDIVNYL